MNLTRALCARHLWCYTRCLYNANCSCFIYGSAREVAQACYDYLAICFPIYKLVRCCPLAFIIICLSLYWYAMSPLGFSIRIMIACFIEDQEKYFIFICFLFQTDHNIMSFGQLQVFSNCTFWAQVDLISIISWNNWVKQKIFIYATFSPLLHFASSIITLLAKINIFNDVIEFVDYLKVSCNRHIFHFLSLLQNFRFKLHHLKLLLFQKKTHNFRVYSNCSIPISITQCKKSRTLITGQVSNYQHY